MKIKVGDRVKFLNDIGAGEVTRIIDQKTAQVQIDGGFEVPWLINDLVVEAGSYNPDEDEEVFVSPKPATFSEKIEISEKEETLEDEEVVLAFLPDSNSSEFQTYLINSSSYHLKYAISRQQEGELILFHEGRLEPGLKIGLGKYLPGNLSQEELFRIQGIFFNHGFFTNLSPLDILLKIEASELYDAKLRKENDYFLEKAILFTLFNWKEPKDKDKPKLEFDAKKLQEAMFTKGDVKVEKVKIPKQELEEVDLHIEQLIDNHKSLDNSEIIEIQLARFRTVLESAILHKSKRIVFIHGVGNGKLKHEIRRIIDSEYRNVRYQDASFKEYGYGATMAIFK